MPLKSVFVFDSVRLRSHLFFRWLSTSSQLWPIGHPYLTAAMFGPEHYTQHHDLPEIRVKEVEQIRGVQFCPDTFESATDHLMAELERTNDMKGKTLVANEHWFNFFKIEIVLGIMRGNVKSASDLGHNPTRLPGEVLDYTAPIILIRHPLVTVNSIYRSALQYTKQRPGTEEFSMIADTLWSRLLFDFFKSRGKTPIIVDGDDLLWRTQDVRNGVATRLGINPETLHDTWEPTPKEETDKLHPLQFILTKDIHESRGIVYPPQKPEEPDTEMYFQKWTNLYGGAIALQLKSLAEDNIPHYSYLQTFKV